MSNTLDKGVCDKHKSENKVVCNHCVLCRFFDAPHVCILKKITLVTKIEAYINLPEKVCQTTINQTFQRVNRRKEN